MVCCSIVHRHSTVQLLLKKHYFILATDLSCTIQQWETRQGQEQRRCAGIWEQDFTGHECVTKHGTSLAPPWYSESIQECMANIAPRTLSGTEDDRPTPTEDDRRPRRHRKTTRRHAPVQVTTPASSALGPPEVKRSSFRPLGRPHLGLGGFFR